MNQTGMLVVSLRGVNFGCLVFLRVFRAKPQYLIKGLVKVSFRVAQEEIEKINYTFDMF